MAKSKLPTPEEQEAKRKRRKALRAKRRAAKKAKASDAPSKPHRLPPAGKDPFYRSAAWKKVRYEVLIRDNATCVCCGRSAKDGFVMNVDHIKPRRKFPELSLCKDNLQTLCSACNEGKGVWDHTDWRDAPPQIDPLTREYREIIGLPACEPNPEKSGE